MQRVLPVLELLVPPEPLVLQGPRARLAQQVLLVPERPVQPARLVPLVLQALRVPQVLAQRA